MKDANPTLFDVIPNPKKEAIDVDPREMSQETLLLELRRLGSLNPERLHWTTNDGRKPHLELYETCLDQWENSPMTDKARRFAEKLVRQLKFYDKLRRAAL